ncbi:MAG TPA: flagellar hook-basal body complex protein [Gemmataceae bacterium]|nr:flagellar hook-basal body complex protein [Gemmataceae bacterium]
MSSSLLTGVSGLTANQEMLDVVGNNLANLNTTGFKAQTPLFSDLLYQTLSPASASSKGSGTNPIQVGFGTMTSSVETNFTQGTLTTTGNPLDAALQGQGFFVANNGSQDLYTRAGAFNIDAAGYLVDPSTGYMIQRVGTVGQASATSPGFQTAGNDNIQIPLGTGIPGKATDNVTIAGNLDAQASGPTDETLTSASPFETSSGPATTTTTLNSLSDNTSPYQTGDSIVIQGTTASGTAVNTTLSVGPTTTLGDVINAINTDFPGSTASLDSSGNLVIQSNTTGSSQLSVSLSDSTGDQGASSWTNQALQQTTAGAAGATVNAAVQVYDTQGTAHTLSLTFQKQANNTWNMTASIPASDGSMINNTITGISFNSDGSFRQVSGSDSISFNINGLPTPQTVSLNFGSPNGFNGLTQFGSASTASATGQDGYAAGTLSSVSIAQDGTINGLFTNGQIYPLAQLAVAQFSNPAGLSRVGQNYYQQTINSGTPLVSGGQAGGAGSVQGGSLESSNVDVSQEFTQLITAQQGYEVNSRSISINNQVIQDLVNIIH